MALENTLKELFFHQLEDDLIAEMERVGKRMTLKSGDMIMDIGDAMPGMPLVINGAVKVLREDSEGNELLLYFLEAGDTCVMSFSCCMASKKSKVRAITEGATELLIIPVQYMNDWVHKFQSWRAYVFDAVRIRMDEFIEAVDSLAFMRLDERLLKYLRDRARVLGTPNLEITHQEIAYDLNTSRVVVSRLLKRLENDNVLNISRNHLEIIEL